MKKIRNFTKRHLGVANLMACMAFAVSSISANTLCVFIFHQPELPAEVRKLKNF
jgi:cyclic lactone autoinducer peptide